MSNLTEKWKAGELEDRFYYTQTGKDKITAIDIYDKESNIWLLNSDKDFPPFEVLATVPSYQELQDLKKYEKTINSYNGMPIDYTIACETVNKLLDEKDVLKKKIHILTESQMKLENTIGEVGEENARLKKLLKEVKEHLCHHYCEITVGKLEKKINEVLR